MAESLSEQVARPDWSDSITELAHDAIASEGDIDGEDVEIIARAYLALRAEVKRLTGERDDHKQAAIHANDWAAQAEAEMKQAKADLAALREDKAQLEQAVVNELARLSQVPMRSLSPEEMAVLMFANKSIAAVGRVFADAARASQQEGRDNGGE